MKNLLLILGIILGQFSFSQNESELIYKEACLCITNGEYEKSIELLEKSIELDSLGNCETGYNGKAHNELGYAYMRIGKLNKSRHFFDQSIELYPLNLDPRMNKVASFILEKDLEKAKTYLDELIEKVPWYPMAYWQKGNILENEGKTKDALLEYRKALAFNRKLNFLPKELVDKMRQKLKNN